MNTQRIIHLTPPQLANGNIKEKVTCIRAHRERIFFVGTEKQHGKLICHNYGHGGAGWTFLFGCVEESLRQLQEECKKNNNFTNQPIAVVGAGCHGLLTAILLHRSGYTVRIVAKEADNLPSNKAAGFFFPRARKCSSQEERAVFEAYGMASYTRYLEIIAGKHPFIKNGPLLLPAYYGLDIDPGFAPYIQRGLVQQPEQVTINFGNSKQYEVMEYHTIFMNPSIMMQELTKEIKRLGITTVHQELESLNELPEQIIFNCAGLGVRKLTSDKRIVPVQGHLISLKEQNDINQLQYLINVKVVQTDANGTTRDELIYFAPKEEGILGITFKRGEDSLTANPHEFDRLLSRCRTFFGE